MSAMKDKQLHNYIKNFKKLMYVYGMYMRIFSLHTGCTVTV